MLSLNLPALTETLTLSGVEVTVHQLPLFFHDHLSRAYPVPSEEGQERTARLLAMAAMEVVESLKQTDHIQFNREDADGALVIATGRPDWKAGPEVWNAYADACVQALTQANFTSTHYSAVQKATRKLEGKQLDGLARAGNS